MMCSFVHIAVFFLYGEFSHVLKLKKFSLVIKKGQKVEMGDASRTKITLQSSYQTTVKLLHGLQLIFSQSSPPLPT